MSPRIPEGTPVGEIEASLAWLVSHTPRFLGVIFVRVGAGGGFILIEFGRPAGFFFRKGDLILQGVAAGEFFERQKFMHASLYRYTAEEFREGLAAAGPEVLVPEVGEGMQEPGKVLPPLRVRIPEKERTPEMILDHIYGSPGVTSAAFFRKGSILHSRGENALGSMVEPAEEILLTSVEILVLLSAGPLAQATLRFPGNNITIAPFKDGYLLIRTEPDVNIGQIRKLVNDFI
jgi:hypothetical protein